MPLYLQRLTETAVRPTRASVGSAGLDLYALHGAVLQPGQRQKILTGIAVAIAPGYVGLICPRSGSADQNGITVLNAPDILDSDYRGEIGVILINHGDTVYEVARGSRIAQLLVVPVGMPNLIEVDALPETARGTAGFGSTGA